MQVDVWRIIADVGLGEKRKVVHRSKYLAVLGSIELMPCHFALLPRYLLRRDAEARKDAADRVLQALRKGAEIPRGHQGRQE